MTLDDILKLVQQLLTMYKKEKDRERIEVILENIYALLLEGGATEDEVIDFMDSVMVDVEYLVENRNEIIIESDNEKENKKRRRKMLDMFSEDYL